MYIPPREPWANGFAPPGGAQIVQPQAPPSILDMWGGMANQYNPLPPGQGTYDMAQAPPMRQAPTPKPAAPAPQAPPMRQAPQQTLQGMYGGGFGSGPLGQQFMYSSNGVNWAPSGTNPQNSGGWQATQGGDPDGQRWTKG